MIRNKLRTDERRQDRARLAAPQLFPLAGDGPAALTLTEMLRPGYRGPDSYLGRNRRGQWDSISLRPTREALVAARYRDWLAERDKLTSLAA